MKFFILMIMVTVGWFVFAKLYAKNNCLAYGMSSSMPMGTVQCLDKNLTQLGLVKISEMQVGLPEMDSEKLLSWGYAVAGNPSGLSGGESISLFMDDGGRLRAVIGGYLLSSEASGAHASAVSKFMAAYWKQTIGGEPVFSQRFVAESPENPAGVQQFSVVAQGSVYGRWIRGTSFGTVFVYDKRVPISHEQINQERRVGEERTINGENMSHWKSVLSESVNAEERRQAAQLLAHFGAETIPSLIEALHDTDSHVRGDAKRSLIRIGPVAIPTLRLAFDDADQTAAFLAAEAVVKIGKESVPVLVELVKGGYTDSWRRMLSVLHMMVPEARAVAVSELGQLLQDSDNEVMARAWSAMSQMGPEKKLGAPFFIQALGGDPRVREQSAGLLRRNGKLGVSILIDALQNQNPEIRLEAAKTLGSFDPGRLREVLPDLDQLCSRELNQSVQSEVCRISKRGS